MTVESYALKILSDHGCDCYTYGGENAHTVLNDLKAGYPDGMEFPYVDVANAILAISKVKPIHKAPWVMVFDTGDNCDGIDHEFLEAAKDDARETLVNWMIWERQEWEAGVFCPTEDELDEYNYMICNSSVEVMKYNPMTDEYEEYWSPSYEDEESVGWKELTMEDIKREEAECNG